MVKACELKRGGFVNIKAIPHQLETLQVSSPSARGAATLYHLRFRNMITKAKVDLTCKGDEAFEDADFEMRPCQYLYEQQGVYAFMDQESYEQFELDKEMIEGQLPYLLEDMENILAIINGDGKVLAIQMPPKVILTIAECDPVMKGATATARPKPAKMETGVTVMVPEYMEPGQKIFVDTATGEFLGRDMSK